MSTEYPEIRIQPRTRKVYQALVLFGAATFLLGVFVAPQRAWANLLLLSFALSGLGLGGAFFIALQYVSGAGWATALRRVPEAMFLNLPVGAVGLILVLLFRPSLYPWYDPTPELASHLTGFKLFWLDRPFFLLRSVTYLAVWLVLARALIRNSRLQDADGDPRHTSRNHRLSAIFMPVFGLTFCLASFDWIMSLEPEWFSTIFGVYNFAGLFVATMALIVVVSVWLQGAGPFRDVLTAEHLHDFGKLLFGFATFWAYIWFSQYMLIWYANIPEETGYFELRWSGAWSSLFLLNFTVNWAIPFFVLLLRWSKRSGSVMSKVGLLLLVGHWLDLFMMIMPPVTGAANPQFGLWELGSFAAAVGIVPLLMLKGLNAAAAVPHRDPRLQQSLSHVQ